MKRKTGPGQASPGQGAPGTEATNREPIDFTLTGDGVYQFEADIDDGGAGEQRGEVVDDAPVGTAPAEDGLIGVADGAQI